MYQGKPPPSRRPRRLESAQIQGLGAAEFEPWSPLLPYLERITIYEAQPHCSAVLEVLPRLNLVMGFQYGESVRAYRRGVEQTLHRSGLTGVQTITRHAQHTGAKYVLVHLKAWSGPAFLPGSMAEYLDRHVDLGSVLPRRRIAETQQRVEEAASQRDKVEAVQRFLLGNLRAGGIDPVAKAAVELFHESDGNARVRELARALNLSDRQFERRFRQAIGIAPKQFSALWRFGQSVRLHGLGLQTADIAVACGYFDQPHFTRAFGRIAGRPPARFFSQGARSLLP